MKHYTLYCSADNEFCSIAKNTLTRNNIAFDTLSVDTSSANESLMRVFEGENNKTPKVFYGAEYVGDLGDIERLFNRTV